MQVFKMELQMKIIFLIVLLLYLQKLKNQIEKKILSQIVVLGTGIVKKESLEEVIIGAIELPIVTGP